MSMIIFIKLHHISNLRQVFLLMIYSGTGIGTRAHKCRTIHMVPFCTGGIL